MVKKLLLNQTSKILFVFSIGMFLFFSFSSLGLAVNYGAGTYNSGYYSDTAPLRPTGTPSAGTYTGAQSVTLTATGSTSIRYSTTIIPADCSSGTVYSTPISISASTTIYARACNSLGNSSTSTLAYLINTATTPTTSSHGGMPLYVLQEISDKARANQNNAVLPSSKAFLFNKNLYFRMTNNDIKELQKYLNNTGFTVAKIGAGSKGNETTKFGPATKAAVIKFQKANKISPAVGYFGPITRAKIKSLGL